MASTILIVDGDARARAQVAQELQARGHRVACAGDALELGRRLEQPEGWDAVLARAEMPGLSGLDLLRAVKNAWPQAEVIISADREERACAVRCLSAGAFAIVQRPYELYEVHAVVSRALERRSLRISEAHYQALRGVMAEKEKLPESIVRAFAQALEAKRACLLVPAPEDGRLTVAYMWGSEGQAPHSPPWLLEWLSTDEAPSIVGPAAGDAAPPRTASGPGIVYPLIAEGRLVAILTAHRTRPQFVAADLERAGVLAVHARVALENERLLQHVASADRLVSLGQLAASIAHEIRTPLTYVLENSGYVSEHLERFAPAPSAHPTRESVTFRQMRRAATDAVDGANRIRDIIRDIGALASADETTRFPFDLKEAIRAALRMSQAELRGRAKISLRLDSDTTVVGSVGRMSQVFVNLLVNAAQAIDTERAVEGKIVIVARREGARVVIEVSDNGPGIRPEVIHRVFEPFFTTKSAGEGTGLGLFLCRDIVRRHGGEMRVRSSPQHGTTFVVDLPADSSQPVRADAREAEKESAAQPVPVRSDLN